MSSNVVAELVAVLGIQTDSASIQKAESALENLAGKVKGFLAAGALLAVGKTVADFVINTAHSLDQLGDTAERLGVTAESFSALQYAVKLAGGEVEDVEASLQGLNLRLGMAAAGNKEMAANFAKAGIVIRDAAGKVRKADDVLFDVADRLASLDTTAERSALAMQLLGKSGIQTVGALSKGASELKALQDEGFRSGAIVAQKDIDRAGKFVDRLDKLTFRITRLKDKALAALLPVAEFVVGAIEGVTNSVIKMDGAFKAFGLTIGLGGLAAISGLIASAGGLQAVLFGVSAAIGSSLIPALAPLATVLGTVVLPLGVMYVILDEIIALFDDRKSVLKDFIAWANDVQEPLGSLTNLLKTAVSLLFDLTDPQKWKRLGDSLGAFKDNPLLGGLSRIAVGDVAGGVSTIISSDAARNSIASPSSNTSTLNQNITINQAPGQSAESVVSEITRQNQAAMSIVGRR